MDARELTRTERAAIRKLVTALCANYDGEYGCLPLDCPCYMLGKWWTGAYCRYFQNAVLPTDPVFEAALLGTATDKTCAICKAPLYDTGNRAKYCGACAEATRLKRQRGYMRKKRAGR